MRLFDTHAHLTDEAFDGDRQELIAKLSENGVELVLTCGSNIPDSENAVQLAQENKSIYAAVGVHGLDAANASPDWFERLKELAESDKVIAIGEIGLDYHYEEQTKELQKEMLTRQLELACELDLPVVLHDREAHADMLSILQSFGGKVRGVMHCYSGSAESVREIEKLGLYFCFGGTLTFKKSEKTRKAALAVPKDRLLIETDCPYLAPEPFRGKRNQPALCAYACRTLASLFETTEDEMAELTLKNGKRLFSIPD